MITGELDYMQDPPPADIKPEVKAKYSDRYHEQRDPVDTYYMFMNTRVPPFDKKEVREAVNYGARQARAGAPVRRRAAAGLLVPAARHAGLRRGARLDDCPWGDPNKPPDIEKATQMIKDAGVAGAKVTVWGNNDDPTDKVTEAYADQLNKMGFNATPKIVDGGVYFQTIGNAKTRRRRPASPTGSQDFPHPTNFFFLAGRQVDPADQQPELRQRRRPGRSPRGSPS